MKCRLSLAEFPIKSFKVNGATMLAINFLISYYIQVHNICRTCVSLIILWPHKNRIIIALFNKRQHCTKTIYHSILLDHFL